MVGARWLIDDRLSKTSSAESYKQPEEKEPTCTKIYYTSRTHSQLSQVLHELHKLNITLSPESIVSLHTKDSGPSGKTDQDPASNIKRPISDDEDTYVDRVDVRTVSLASRKQLCVNEKLKSKHGDLDEACRQLLGGKIVHPLLVAPSDAHVREGR